MIIPSQLIYVENLVRNINMDDKLAFPGRLGQPDLALPFDSRLDPRLRQAFLAISDATDTIQNAGVDRNSSYEEC